MAREKAHDERFKGPQLGLLNKTKFCKKVIKVRTTTVIGE